MMNKVTFKFNRNSKCNIVPFKIKELWCRKAGIACASETNFIGYNSTLNFLAVTNNKRCYRLMPEQ